MSFCTVSQGLGGLGLAWKRDVGRHPWALGGLPARGDTHGSGWAPPPQIGCGPYILSSHLLPLSKPVALSEQLSHSHCTSHSEPTQRGAGPP